MQFTGLFPYIEIFELIFCFQSYLSFKKKRDEKSRIKICFSPVSVRKGHDFLIIFEHSVDCSLFYYMVSFCVSQSIRLSIKLGVIQ